ncbi:FKBP-type peptidyl-prolyl cis-trans isomerase [Thiomicrorhabdus xiamenensis]|uniref:Peptidyl-prolyl cis-trans isomerase n=1 Tax=Thiomicrorhabdus xiamenensis TaxID=2739063 RepID=A0A7D4SIX2_9GAMM|nr:peptidylprolyl isomerase [Thiomicrorhabdus xiamenensis]QKI89299.1 peptidylprolyl isomerase [Thiomicrorhabdus xiamenensis]
MNITKDIVGLFEYTLSNDSGETLDASNGNPLAYLHGHGNIIPGLEKQMEGKKVGDKFTAQVPAAEGYGERVEQLVQTVPSAMFQGVEQIEVGMRFEAQSEHGVHSVEVTKIEGENVTVDGNHPLAGVDLTFEIEITGVRAATDEEIEHGHAHGEGGHHH